jgi:hypothetical protein
MACLDAHLYEIEYRFLIAFHCFFLTATEKKNDKIIPSFSCRLPVVSDLC